MKGHEFDSIVTKFGLRTRDGRDLWAWLEYQGRKVVRTRRSKGSGDLPTNLIRQQLRLSDQELRDAITCALALDGYLDILRRKGVIETQ